MRPKPVEGKQESGGSGDAFFRTVMAKASQEVEASTN